MRWFQNSFVGTATICSDICQRSKICNIKKAQIDLEKAKTTKDMVTDQLSMQDKQLRYNLENANLQYRSQKDNVEVSKRVYTSMENKYQTGNGIKS